jgi:hypothetical protein
VSVSRARTPYEHLIICFADLRPAFSNCKSRLPDRGRPPCSNCISLQRVPAFASASAQDVPAAIRTRYVVASTSISTCTRTVRLCHTAHIPGWLIAYFRASRAALGARKESARSLVQRLLGSLQWHQLEMHFLLWVRKKRRNTERERERERGVCGCYV